MNKAGTGMVLGKFHPPTLGHQYLVDFARAYVSELTVIVGSLRREEIPGKLRAAWMREMFPDVHVAHLTDENPQEPHEHPDFWRIWYDSIRRILPAGPDYVFASETYGWKLAEVLGARFIPVDIGRSQVPVSGTAVRSDPMRCWELIPACVRPYFVRRVCIIGPESTGKSTLARSLAERFRTRVVEEYARLAIDAHGGEVTPALWEVFARGQAASEAALARQANRVLICDSDAFTTALYHELFTGRKAPAIEAEATLHRYDLYLVTDCDTPYVEDAQRNHPWAREWFRDSCLKWVRARGTPWVLIRGSWAERFDSAREAVERLLAAPSRPLT